MIDKDLDDCMVPQTDETIHYMPTDVININNIEAASGFITNVLDTSGVQNP